MNLSQIGGPLLSFVGKDFENILNPEHAEFVKWNSPTLKFGESTGCFRDIRMCFYDKAVSTTYTCIEPSQNV